MNDAQTVLLTKPDDARKSSHIVGGGQIRFANGDVMNFGAAPKFMSAGRVDPARFT